MKPTTINDLYSYTFLGNMKTSANSLVFVKANCSEEENTYEQVLYDYRASFEQARQLTSFKKESNFAYKDPNTIGFISNRSMKKDRCALYEISLDGGEAMEILEIDHPKTQLVGYLVDHTIVFLQEDEEEKTGSDYEILDETPFYRNGEGITNKKRHHLVLYRNGQWETITEKLTDISMIKIDHDTIYVLKEEVKHKFSYKPGLYTYHPSLKKWTTLVEPNTLMIQDFIPFSKGIYVFASTGAEYGLNQNPDLYIIDEDGCHFLEKWGYSLGNTVGTDMASVPGNSLAIHDDILYFTSTKDDHVELYRYQDGFHKVYAMDGTIHAFGFVENSLYFIGAKEGALQELYCLKGEDALLPCSSFNALDSHVSVPRRIQYKDFEGKEQVGYVLYPIDFDPDKSYPGILDIHGGPKTVYGTVFYHEMQVWASRGYFVFFCNPHGSDGKDDVFADIRGKYGTIDYEDILLFVDTVLDQIPQIDPERLGVTGGSYGGFMTNWIIGHTNKFKAAASQRSISNWISFYNTSDIGPEFTNDQQGATIEDDLEKLWFHSPLQYAKQAKTPTLFIHSDEDYRCPLSEGLQMLNALLQNDIEARMCMFHQENHELSRSGRPHDRIKRLEEITNWMDKYLKK